MSIETVPVTRPPAVEAAPRPEPAPGPRVWQRTLAARWAVPAALAALVLVSLWLRTKAIHFYFWVDEGLSVGIASHPLAHIPGVLRQDGSPPLYYALLHVWMSIFGRGVVATHVLSLIFGLLVIPLAYWIAGSLWDRRAGLAAAVLAAGSPWLTVYSEETRMYALVALLSLVLAGSFVQVFVRRSRRHLPLFSVALAAELYTHNWALFLGVAAAAAFLLCVLEAPVPERRGLWRDGLIGFGAAGLLFLPWLPTLVYQAGHTGAPWDLPPVLWSLTQALYALVGGRGAAVALLLGGGTGLLLLRRREDLRLRLPVAARELRLPRLPLEVECLLVLGLGTLLVAWAYSKVHPAWAFRYLAVIVGPLLLAFALGLARGGRLALVALLLVGSWWVLDPKSHNLNSKSNVASIAKLARPHLRTDPLVLSTQPEQVATIAYYLPNAHRFATPLGLTPDPGVTDWRGALERLERSSVTRVLRPLLARVAPGQRVLLVVPTNLAKHPLWMSLINRDTTRWEHALNHDPGFRRLAVYTRGMYSAGVAVEGILYERR